MLSRIQTGPVLGAAVLTAVVVGFSTPTLTLAAAPDPLPTARFLDSGGYPLSADWQIEPGAPTFLVVHGFDASGTEKDYLDQAEAIRWRYPEANLVIVDWRPPPEPPNWPKGNPTARILIGLAAKLFDPGKADTAAEYYWWMQYAEQVGRDIAGWMHQKQIPPSNTVICGHSLGAHVAAFAANHAEGLVGQRVGAILASDPAGPLFQGRDPSQRLDPTDAEQVVVVHGSKLLGDWGAIGTVDIYITWPELPKTPDPPEVEEPEYEWQHRLTRELLTRSFRQPELSNDDGTPFGANALDHDFGDAPVRAFQARVDVVARPSLGTAIARAR
jgi:pimeloyl-ACP methyl ester carboxylesterase